MRDGSPSSPNITVGVPTRNSASTISRCLRSICASSVSGIRIIVSDNHSSDQTLELVRMMALEDPRIEVVEHASDHGALGNFKFLLEQADTPYFAWVGSDDTLDPQYLEACLDALAENPGAALAFGSAEMSMSSSGRIVAEYRATSRYETPAKYRRAWRVICDFPSVNFYGVYRTHVLKSSFDWKAPSVAFDTVLLRRLSLEGAFLSVSNVKYNYSMTDQWKTISQYRQSHGRGGFRALDRLVPSLDLLWSTIRAGSRRSHSIRHAVVWSALCVAAETKRYGNRILATAARGIAGREPANARVIQAFLRLNRHHEIDVIAPKEFAQRIARPWLRW